MNYININIFNLLLFLLLLGPIIIFLIPKNNNLLIKKTGFLFSSILFILTVFFWFKLNRFSSKFQLMTGKTWVQLFNLNISLGLDGISILFILLTTLLITICFLSSWNSIKYWIKEYLIGFLILELFLILVFSLLDLLLFFIFFESVLIPMFLIITIWGSRERKIKAAYLFFLYTLFGSVLMLLGIVYIYFRTGTTDYNTLLTIKFSIEEQKLLWLAFFASFAVKVPMWPLHVWLPEAHVEAPTTGSVILAGILLKLGTYGFIRFSLPLFPEATVYFTPLLYTLALIGILYTSLIAIRQLDLKRIIAYTSIAHMNLVLIGLFSCNFIGISGAILQSLSHGFVSSALFLIVGVLYDRHHTRLITYYSGLTYIMPLFSIFFLFFTLANIALPGTSSFIGEFLILSGSFRSNLIATFIGATGMIIGAIYSLWLLNRIIYGNLKIQYISRFSDISLHETISLLPLAILTFFMGIYPKPLVDTIIMPVNKIVELFY